MEQTKRQVIESHFAAGLREAIEPDWREFEGLAAGASVQAFCAFESCYIDERLSVERPLSIFEFEPSHEQYTPEHAALLLGKANDRADVFLRGLLEVYCQMKRRPLPDREDTEAVTGILNTIMSGGVDKIRAFVARSNKLDDPSLHMDQQSYYDRLAPTLLMVAARLKTVHFYGLNAGGRTLEAHTPQLEIDATLNDVLRESCQKIIRGEKHHAPKDGDGTDKIFASSMNAIRTLYHQGTDAGLQRQIFLSPIFTRLLAAEFDRYAHDPVSEADAHQRQRDVFDTFASRMNKLIGTTYTYPGTAKLSKMFSDREAITARQNSQQRINMLTEAYVKMANIHSARHIVDSIASGTLQYSEITHAIMQLNKLPLAPVEAEKPELPEETVEWEVLPQDELGPRAEDYSPHEGIRQSIPIDMTRIHRLRDYAKGWPGAYIVRGTPASYTANSIRSQYYVLVLPQKLSEPLPDGTTHIEHAIADSPKLGHGLYIFRAEAGQAYQPALTWREVFSQKRGEPVKRLGALCLRHTATLEYNLLNALTCPPHEIETRRRYLQSLRALRLARKLQPAA